MRPGGPLTPYALAHADGASRMAGTLLPLPNVGGVEGAMIGALIGHGVDAGVTIIAVFTYRAIAYWLPTVPGLVAYFQLRGMRRLPRSSGGVASTP